MAYSSEEMRNAAHQSKLLALQAKDPELRARLFVMAADIERQALEAEEAVAKEACHPNDCVAASRAVPRQRSRFGRRRKPK